MKFGMKMNTTRNAECGMQKLWCPRTDRRHVGISLLEVLISIFVLAVGLLSVAALMPLGNYEVEQGKRLEKVVAVGDWGMNTMQSAGGFDPSRWISADGLQMYDVVSPSGPRLLLAATGSSTASSVVANGTTGLSPSDDFYNGCVLEFRSGPLQGVKRFINSYTAASRSFGLTQPLSPTPTDGDRFTVTRRHAFVIDPLGVATNANLGTFPYTNGILSRVTLTTAPGSNALMSAAMAEGLMTSTDSLSISTPEDGNEDPMQLLLDANGDGNAVDKRLSDGEYSYLVMMAPFTFDDSGMYNASIVVFESRFLSGTADSFSMDCSFVGGGYGGGEVLLSNSNFGVLDTIKPGHWLLVHGPNGPYRWYRVAAGQAVETGDTSRYVSLVGPDWTPTGGEKAVLLQRVVGVYEKPVRVKSLPLKPTG